ncbi:MAG TPA: PBP1A family penicillin-binding protein [Methylomirabilota bacterium]|nr:PBP1A family penicillin-binding protein [Methylomirabilota bacterium]
MIRRRLTLSRLGLAAIVLIGLALVALLVYSWVELARFDRVEARRTAFVYAAPQALAVGVHVRHADLLGTLTRLHYTETRQAPQAPGQFRRGAAQWDLSLRGLPGTSRPQVVHLQLKDERIVRVTRDGRDIGAAALEPEVLTSAGDRPGEEYRPIQLADVPLVLMQAVLAAEDHRFFEHKGVDLRSLLRALWVNLRAGRVAQGGSTITQQLVKNRLLDPKRTLARKIDEAWLATLVEWRYPKERILEAYLNEIYLGHRGALAIRGVGAAARAYFHKEVHQLNLAESALLAGMLRGPNTYSPSVNPTRARERRDVVIGRMLELGFVSAADAQAARRQPVGVADGGSAQPAPYFSDYVRQELEARYGDDAVRARDARIFTTLDLTLQRLAERAVARGLERLEASRPRLRRAADGQRLQAALVALDPATGHVRALVGGRDYQASQYNRATLARRQPGSAFKPFVYATAIASHEGHGFTAATFLDDSPLTLMLNGAPWSPHNYEDRYLGRVTLRQALEQSLNAATVRLAQDVGLPAIVERARAFGLTGALEPVPSMVLGAFEVTPLELAGAYVPFANGGMRPSGPHAVQSVQDRRGVVEPSDEGEPRTVLSPAEAYVMTSLLEGVITSGTGAQARALGVPGAIAGKTGTTNDGRDAWFVGYAPGLLTAVWVGFDSNEPHGLSGAQGALPIWAEFMRPALEAYAPQSFTVPSGVLFADIDLDNGKLANRFCPHVGKEVFVAGTEPEPCRDHGGLGDRVQEWWERFRDWLRR